MFLDNRTPEYQERNNNLHLLPLFPPQTKKKEDISAYQNENFESKKFSEDEHISPRRSALFINWKEAQASLIQNFNL